MKDTVRGRGVIVVGDLLYDMVSFVDGPVAPGVDTFTEIQASPGGSGSNVASWLAKLGTESHFVGRVGRDVFGEYLAAELEASGAFTHLVPDDETATGKVFVMVDGAGERTMITDRGASENIAPENLPKDLFDPDLHLHLTGYMFSGGTRRETALLALKLAGEAGMTVSVDPSSAPLIESVGAEAFIGWTADADLVFPNLPEGRALTGETEPDAVLDALTERYATVVLKLGAGGAVFRRRGDTPVFVPATPQDPDSHLDTTGAGDALCAGFLAAAISGSNPREALAAGVELAGRVVREAGGHPGAA